MAVKKLEKTLKAMKIGVDNAVVAKVVEDTDGRYQLESLDGSATIMNLPGVMAINVNPNMSQEVAFYDNGPGETASTLGAIDISFNKSALGSREKAFLFGSKYNSLEEVTSSVQDVSPTVAFGFRTLRSDGSYKYVWMLKGKFVLPPENNETKGDSINFQSEEITGKFLTTNYRFGTEWSGDGRVTKRKKLWKLEMDESFIPELPDATAQNKARLACKGWFDQVLRPSQVKNLQLTTNVTLKMFKYGTLEETTSLSVGENGQMWGTASAASTATISAFTWSIVGDSTGTQPAPETMIVEVDNFGKVTAKAAGTGFVKCTPKHGTPSSFTVFAITVS